MAGFRRSDLLLVVGMLAGASMAAMGLVGEIAGPDRSMPEEAVAIVGEATVSRASFETAIGLVERDRGGALTVEERQHILERLIDEELLLQRGLALGLPRSDRKLRGDIVAAVIEAATSTADVADPSDAELRAFFEQNRDAFEGPVSMRIAQVFVAIPPRSDADAAKRVREVADRLRAGEDVVAVRRELGDPPAVEIPASAQPASKLRDWIGPTAAAAAHALRVGEVSEPLRGDDGYRVLVALERGEASADTFAAKSSEILLEYRRRAGEKALRDYIADLRAATEVSVGRLPVATAPSVAVAPPSKDIESSARVGSPAAGSVLPSQSKAVAR